MINPSGKQVVLAGAGHAHMTILKHLDAFRAAGHRVTVIGPGAHHYYSGMGPGMLSGMYRPEEIRFDVKAMVAARGAQFIEDRVVRVDARRHCLYTQRGRAVPFDIASFNTGSRVVIPESIARHADVVPVKPIENLLDVRHRLLTALRESRLSLAVAGGGPAGLEIAANLRRLVTDARGEADIVLIAGRRLLSGFDPAVRRRAQAGLSRLHITVIEGQKVAGAAGRWLWTTSGERRPADLLVMATGVKPSPIFAASGLPVGPDGGLKVNRYLQAEGHPELFGGGDCIYFSPQPLARVGVYAVRQNPILLQNLQRTLAGRALIPFTPQQRYLLAFNLGDGTAIVRWRSLLFDGRPGFFLKDFLDRRFMNLFQDSR